MPKPIILITVGRRNEQAERTEVQAVTTGCDVRYIYAVVQAGGAPVIMPCTADREAIAAIVPAVAGVLLTGGGDVTSLKYDEEPHHASGYQDPTRDDMEVEAVRLALERGLPILGIRRGQQLLNVALEGAWCRTSPPR